MKISPTGEVNVANKKTHTHRHTQSYPPGQIFTCEHKQSPETEPELDQKRIEPGNEVTEAQCTYDTDAGVDLCGAVRSCSLYVV